MSKQLETLIRDLFTDADVDVTDWDGGTAFEVQFTNSFGASIIRHGMSYGNRDGLWEIAVLKDNGTRRWSITKDTEVTNDTIGWLTELEVIGTLIQIENL